MVINESILYSAGAEIKNYRPTEFIFKEGDGSYFYYQIVKGDVKLNNYDQDGKEFIQNILSEGQSCGESILFIDKNYPMNAEAMTDCSILKLCKQKFFRLLTEYPEIYMDICTWLSQRLYYKFIMMQNISYQDAIVRLRGLMEYLKSFHDNHAPYSFLIPLTRQQMASLTGLRVETAIRTLKTMEQQKVVQIRDRKIYF
ncbi:Crp/Fnr family transcriptional regulator [Chryseobacterium pennipullorum]|uniref:Crp/Fnr family transcriptional regulator n=1 Tax=Chryseobacterium pennipullorum TaxID=2258963 RepID=A0A3D9B1U7_9FLAO|nr:Crp/Fnr family transcriptional regulator [Chryseobacterium pennipullorum]REC47308.1 Crp/Fnr family transcriptional regulator [Chryseobacterium pennipullorum]